MITAKNLVIGHHKALYEIDHLILEAQKLYALIGRNGSGKSTLLHTLINDCAPISGHLEIMGESIHHMDSSSIAQKIAYVGSQFAGISHMTASEYVMLGRIPYLNYLAKPKESDVAAVQHAFEFMQISQLQNRFTEQLSDGERQMVSIAKALAQETPIVLFDEPTAFLDYSNKLKFMQILRRLSESGKCVVFSSHDLELTLQHADWLLCINRKQSELKQLPAKESELADLVKQFF